MIIYKIRNRLTNQITNQWNSDFADETYYEPSFGEPEHLIEMSRQIINEDGSITEAVFETVASEYDLEIEDITAKLEQEEINAEAIAYLNSTDWMILREQETGVLCPIEIKVARQQARARIIR